VLDPRFRGQRVGGRRAVRAGARGHLVNGADRDRLPHAVRAAAAGETIFGAVAAQHVDRELTAPAPRDAVRRADPARARAARPVREQPSPSGSG